MEIKELLIKKGNYSFDVNEWGSCQYSGALAMYKAYFELRKEYSKEKILEYLKYEYGYEIKFSGIRDDDNAKDMFFKILANKNHWNLNLYEYQNDSVDFEKDILEEIDEYKDKEGAVLEFTEGVEEPTPSVLSEYDKKFNALNEYHQELIRNIRRAQSADDLFYVGRNSSFDLWSISSKVAESYFIGFEVKNLPTCDNPIGLERGPVGNICAQADNVLTGLCCALLVDYEIVKNTNSFKHFDT
jgi:hypothetical protein